MRDPIRSGMSLRQSRAFAVALVTFATFTDIVAWAIGIPVLPDLGRRLGASPTVIGFLFASFGVTLLTVSIPMGAVSDRIEGKAAPATVQNRSLEGGRKPRLRSNPWEGAYCDLGLGGGARLRLCPPRRRSPANRRVSHPTGERRTRHFVASAAVASPSMPAAHASARREQAARR